MKILTWNCNGALRKKFDRLIAFNSDILIIQECEDPDRSTDKNYQKWASNFRWCGENKHKGLGIFYKPSIKISNNDWTPGGTKYFISVNVNGLFDLVAVWCHYGDSRMFRYIGQMWKYLQINKGLMKKVVIIGDFNSNKIWDKRHSESSHTDVVRELEEIDVRSLYHEYFSEYQGEEKTATLYLQKNKGKGYHIDYVFASRKVVHKVKSIDIGSSAEWLQYSDHMPFIVDLDLQSDLRSKKRTGRRVIVKRWGRDNED
jgi:exonuclease III